MTVAAAQERFWRRCSPEERLLLACARQDPDSEWRGRIREAAARADWPRVFATAVRHQAAPLVFDNLGRCDVVRTMPQDVAARFHHETVRNMAAKQTLDRELVAALDWFTARGLRVMLIKGTSLDRRVFDSRWSTVCGDLDLLLDRSQDALDPEVGSHVWTLANGKPCVDVHGTPHPDLVMNGVLPIDFAEIWDRAAPADVDGRRAWLMDVHDELICACVQSCRKRYFRLKSLCELGELARRTPQLDWDVLAGRARRWRCHAIVYTALFVAAAAVGCPVPADLRRRLRVARPQAALVRWLALRRSFCRLDALFDDVRVRGKRLNRSLLLRYASHGPRQLWRSAGVVRRQMVRPRT